MEQTGIELYRVLPETLPYGWPAIAPLLWPAVARTHGESSLESLVADLQQEKMQLWVASEREALLAAMVTELTQNNGVVVCEVRYLGGEDIGVWRHLWSQIEDWALIQGCAKVRAYTRPGLAKTLRREGFKETQRVVEKDLRGRMQ